MPPWECRSLYRFADLRVDVGRRAVTRGTSDIHLPKLSFDLLRALIEAAPYLGAKRRAISRGLARSHRLAQTVTQRIKLLRRRSRRQS